MPKVSIIILNYRTSGLTIACANSLISLERQSEREIIVIDNGSGDGSAQKIIKELGGKAKIVISKRNLGFSGGNNLGASQASGDIFLFLNSDTIINQDIFSPCLSALEKDPKLGALSPWLLGATGQAQEFAYGNFPRLLSLVRRKTINKRVKPNKDGLIYTDWISGCALFINRSTFETIGGWDENFFLYYEDVDLCQRLTQAGFHNAVQRKASLIHLGGRSLTYNKTRKKEYYRSQDYYFRKHHGKCLASIVSLARWPYLIYVKLVKS